MEKQRAMLITAMGDKAYTALRNLLAPTLLSKVLFKEMVTKLNDYYMEPENPIVERCKFHNCIRNKKETVPKFLAELRALADKCDFGNSLQIMLRNRFICGINNEKIQEDCLRNLMT